MPVLEILRKVTKSKHVKIISFANNLVENIIIKGVSSLQSNKTIKHLRENIDIMLFDISLKNNFLDMSPQPRESKQ